MQNSVALKKERYDLLMKQRMILDRAGDSDLDSEKESEYNKMSEAVESLDKRIKRLEDLEDKVKDDDDDDDKEEKHRDDEDRDDDEDDDKKEEAGRGRSYAHKSEVRHGKLFSEWRSTGKHGERSHTKDYLAYFDRYLRSGHSEQEFRDLSLTGGDGAGSLVTPTAISKDFVTFMKNYTFIRDLANIQYVNDAQSLGNPRLSADIADADWTAEVPGSDIASDTAMALDRRDLTPAMLTKLAKVSIREVMLAPQVTDIVMDRLAYKFAVSEEKGFLTGDGVTNGQPLGVFTASSSGISTGRDVTASSSTGFSADDLLTVSENIAQQYLQSNDNSTLDKVCWIMHRQAVLRARKLKDGQGNYLYSVSLAAGRPDTLCGFPLKKSEYAPSTFTTGLYVAILGNFNFYRIAIAGNGAPVVQTLVERYSPTNQIGYIGREWIAGAPMREEAFTRLKLA